MRKIKFLLLLIAPLVVLQCHSGRSKQKELIVFHAGSLSLPMKAAADSFMKLHPDVRILLEAAGSMECARKISELHKPCDLFVSSDYKVVEMLIDQGFATWCIPFASNEMVIAYHDKSRLADCINGSSWPSVLLSKEVAFGRSDENSDPCGYRTIMTIRLAEDFYHRPGLADSLLAKDVKHIRPKEVDLIALLEANVIDYLFIYKSVAQQHGLNYLELPAAINLSSKEYESVYSRVSVEVVGSTPDARVALTGEPMVYGLTIPRNAPNLDIAVQFTAFFLSENSGMRILSAMGQTPIIPTSTKTYNYIPQALRAFATP